MCFRISQDVTGHTNVEQNKCEPNTDVIYSNPGVACSDPGNFNTASMYTNLHLRSTQIKLNMSVKCNWLKNLLNVSFGLLFWGKLFIPN